MANHSFQSYSFISLRCAIIILCISMIIVQVSPVLTEDSNLSLSSVEDNREHELSRRHSSKLAKMLKQILQRGEMQIEPHHIHRVLGRLHRRKTIGSLNNPEIIYF